MKSLDKSTQATAKRRVGSSNLPGSLSALYFMRALHHNNLSPN